MKCRECGMCLDPEVGARPFCIDHSPYVQDLLERIYGEA